MPADPVKNFAKVLVVGTYDESATTIQLANGELSKLPNPSTDGQFNLVWWNATDYADPADDPYKEIVRVIAVDAANNTITVMRGQENTVAQPHNIPNKVYKMMLALTQKTYEDLQKIDVYQNSTFVGFRSKLSFVSPLEVEDDTLNQLIKIKFANKFGGDGSDGDLIISSGATTIDLGNQRLFVKNYNNLKITGTASLSFVNPHDEGTIIIFRVKNDCEITSTTNPAIDLRLLGGKGGDGGTPSSPAGKPGNPTWILNLPIKILGGGGGGNNSVGGNVSCTLPTACLLTNILLPYFICLAPGSGGGGGNFGGGYSIAGKGGRGGGCLLLEVGGALTFTSSINASGENGQNGTVSGSYSSGSGGGGGGGMVVIVYNKLIQNTGSINVSKGLGGSGFSGTSGAVEGGGGGASIINPGEKGYLALNGTVPRGGDGGDGIALIIKNSYL